MSALEWFAVIAGGASVASLPVALVLGWFGKRAAVDIHTATQSTLADISKGFRETQQALSETTKTVGQGVQQLGQILTQMDQHWREAFERMDHRADERHREVVEAIQALRR
jgi:molecular chaperone GrpE (heat shock protein)